jgi:transposase
VDAIPLVHDVLENIEFAGVIDGFCGDDGDVAASAVIEALVLSRLDNLRPLPLSHLAEWVGRTVLPHLLGVLPDKLNEYRAGRLLERLGVESASIWRQLVLNVKLQYGLDLDLVVYDTTSIYFEGEYEESTVVQYGHSRDSKPHCKQVVIDLDVTGQDAIPVMYGLVPGNVSDGDPTVQKNLVEILALAKEMGLKPDDITMLGDRAMLSPRIAHVYCDNGVGYIGSMRDSELTKQLANDVSEADLLAHPLSYVPAKSTGRAEDSLYYGVRRTVTIKRPTQDKIPKGRPSELQQWALVVLGMGKKRLDSNHRETLLTKIEARLVDIASHLNKGQYKNKVYAENQVAKALDKYPAVRKMLSAQILSENGTLHLRWQRDPALITEAAALDGRYVIFFNRPKLSDDDVFSRFKLRDGVERRAGDVKNTVTIRPVYLHDDNRIRGLVLVTMIALLASSLVERQLRRQQIPLTIRGIQDLFRDFTASLLAFSDHSLLLTFPVTNKAQALVLATLGVTLAPFTSPLTGEAQELWAGAQVVPPAWVRPAQPPPDS